MNKYAVLKDKIGSEKRFTRLVSVRKPCQLGFVDLLVYSTLIFRDKSSGCTASRLATITGLHQSVTIPKVLRRLSGFGLVVKAEGKRWVALPPPESLTGWFSMRRAEQLQNSFNTNWIGVPAVDSPLTNLQAAIITQLVLKQSHASIARFLRVSVKTVARTVKILEANGNKFKKVWFQDRGKVERKKVVVKVDNVNLNQPAVGAGSLADSLKLEPALASQLDRNCAVMRAGGIKDSEITKFWGGVLGRRKDPNDDASFSLLYGFPARFAKIDADHKFNVKAGRAVGDSCYRLLCSEFGN